MFFLPRASDCAADRGTGSGLPWVWRGCWEFEQFVSHCPSFVGTAAPSPGWGCALAAHPVFHQALKAQLVPFGLGFWHETLLGFAGFSPSLGWDGGGGGGAAQGEAGAALGCSLCSSAPAPGSSLSEWGYKYHKHSSAFPVPRKWGTARGLFEGLWNATDTDLTGFFWAPMTAFAVLSSHFGA